MNGPQAESSKRPEKRVLYAEDYEPGQVFEVGEHTFTKQEIIDFATLWDPQPFHLDEEFAAQSIFGGIVASGWHVALTMMRMMLEGGFTSAETGLGSPGHDGLKWLKPVFPGDRVTGTIEVTEVRMSRSRPDIGFVVSIAVLKNQRGDNGIGSKAHPS